MFNPWNGVRNAGIGGGGGGERVEGRCGRLGLELDSFFVLQI